MMDGKGKTDDFREELPECLYERKRNGSLTIGKVF